MCILGTSRYTTIMPKYLELKNKNNMKISNIGQDSTLCKTFKFHIFGLVFLVCLTYCKHMNKNWCGRQTVN